MNPKNKKMLYELERIRYRQRLLRIEKLIAQCRQWKHKEQKVAP